MRTDNKIPGIIVNSLNVYTQSYTNNSTMYLTGTTSSDASYKRLYHSPYITMKPYELLVQDRSDTTGVSIGANVTSSTTVNSVTTLKDGGLITINHNEHEDGSSTIATTSSILMSGLDSSIILNKPNTST